MGSFATVFLDINLPLNKVDIGNNIKIFISCPYIYFLVHFMSAMFIKRNNIEKLCELLTLLDDMTLVRRTPYRYRIKIIQIEPIMLPKITGKYI